MSLSVPGLSVPGYRCLLPSVISPLQLWPHPQPKRLWPMLGGLSVLAHIGALGFSLPYMIDLMQSANSSTGSTSIPIELVDAAPDTVTEPGRNVAQRSGSQAKSTQTEVDSLSPERSAVSNQSVRTEPVRTEPVRAESSGTDANAVVVEDPPPRPLRPAQTTAQADDLPVSNTERAEDVPDENRGDRSQNTRDDRSDSSSTQEPSRSDPLDEATEGTAANEDPAPQPSPAPNTRNEEVNDDLGGGAEAPDLPDPEPELPTLPGGEALPTPGEETPADGNDVTQSASLSIVDFSEAPGQQDVGKTPPRPRESSISDAIVLSPVARGCPTLAFSQSRWVYQVAIEADGSVRTATVWTERTGRPMSEEEKAIACLIENAGFEFEPALFDGEPILDDNLLLTIDLIEML
ncbi:MAG: hypothetical protein AB8B99_05690 [Phormidesmis sp.]